MQLGAAWAGMAIESSMLGAAHACANPLTAHHRMVHGHAVALMLPAVMAYNAADATCAALYGEIAVLAGLVSVHDHRLGATALRRRVMELITIAGLPPTLADMGVLATDIPRLAAEAATQWTGRFNPRPVTPFDYCRLYETALNGSST